MAKVTLENLSKVYPEKGGPGVTAVKSINGFTDNNMFAPADQGAGKPPTCWLLGRFENGIWSRVTPKTGFNCSPGGYYTPKS